MSATSDGERSPTRERPTERGGSRATGRIAGVNGLRALAAMLVVGYHAASVSGVTLAGPLALVAAELKAGVAVFFVISGFLLYLPFARAIGAGDGLPSWRQYASGRAVRILPAYWAALAVLAVASQLKGVAAVDAWRYVDLVQIYRTSTIQRGLTVAWSLDVEITFYLALPILAWLIARVTRRSVGSRFEPQVAMVTALTLGSLLLRATLTRSLVAPVGNDKLVLATSLPGMLDWFAIGMGLAVMRAAIELGAKRPRGLVALAERPGLCWLIAAALFFAGEPAQRAELYLPAFGLAAHVAIGLAALFLVLPVVPSRDRPANGFVMPLLSSRVVAWLGVISYGIYLWHVPFLQAFDTLVGRPRGVGAFAGLLAATGIGAVVLGAASWYLIERPAHRVYAHGPVRPWRALRKLTGEPA